jgi:hypothetical protein
MNNEVALTTNRTKRPPAAVHQSLEGWLAHATVAIDNGDLSSLTLPSGPRAGLEGRRDVLRAALAPCSPRAAGMLLASLEGMASRAQPDRETAKALMAQAIADLTDVSEWALAESVRAFRVGHVGEGKWRPTTGELMIEARKREASNREELARLNRILDSPALALAPVKRRKVSPERFAELRAMVSGVARGAEEEGEGWAKQETSSA